MNPIFFDSMSRYAQLEASGQGDTDEAQELLALAFDHAPPEFLQEAARMAKDMGLMPEKPDGYLPDGTAVYSSAGVAKRLGMTEDEVLEGIERIEAIRAHAGLPPLAFDDSNVQRVQ